jgi:hypothetical protein
MMPMIGGESVIGFVSKTVGPASGILLNECSLIEVNGGPMSEPMTVTILWFVSRGGRLGASRVPADLNA